MTIYERLQACCELLHVCVSVHGQVATVLVARDRIAAFERRVICRPRASTCLRHRAYNGEYMLSMSTGYVWTYPSIYPKVLFPVEDPGPRLIRGSLGPPESKPRPNGVWIDSALL